MAEDFMYAGCEVPGLGKQTPRKLSAASILAHEDSSLDAAMVNKKAEKTPFYGLKDPKKPQPPTNRDPQEVKTWLDSQKPRTEPGSIWHSKFQEHKFNVHQALDRLHSFAQANGVHLTPEDKQYVDSMLKAMELYTSKKADLGSGAMDLSGTKKMAASAENLAKYFTRKANSNLLVQKATKDLWQISPDGKTIEAVYNPDEEPIKAV